MNGAIIVNIEWQCEGYVRFEQLPSIDPIQMLIRKIVFNKRKLSTCLERTSIFL